MMSEKKFVVRYQTEVFAEDLFDAIKKSKDYNDLELFEVKEIKYGGDKDE